MDKQRITDNIAIIIFTAILSFTLVLSVAGMLNTVNKLDYRIEMARQEMRR